MSDDVLRLIMGRMSNKCAMANVLATVDLTNKIGDSEELGAFVTKVDAVSYLTERLDFHLRNLSDKDKFEVAKNEMLSNDLWKKELVNVFNNVHLLDNLMVSCVENLESNNITLDYKQTEIKPHHHYIVGSRLASLSTLKVTHQGDSMGNPLSEAYELINKYVVDPSLYETDLKDAKLAYDDIELSLLSSAFNFVNMLLRDGSIQFTNKLIADLISKNVLTTYKVPPN